VFFDKPIAGLKPADSITLSLATAVGVAAIYAQAIGPVSDVHATVSGDGNINAAIKKAGWKSLLLTAAVTFMTRDLNVVYLGGSMVILEHIMYLHAEMSNPATGQISVGAAAYQPAPAPLAAVSGY
jgi:hypothetical protein